MSDEPTELPPSSDAPPKRRGLRPPWRKGQSGNPAGAKAKGYGNAALLREAIGERAIEIIARVVKAALDGDMSACRMILDRVIAPLRPVEPNVQLEILADATLTEQGAAILQAVAIGKLSPMSGSQLLMGLGSQARVLESDELKARIAAIEDRMRSKAS